MIKPEPMTYQLEIIDKWPCARVFVNGVKTSASIRYIPDVDQSHLGGVVDEMKYWFRRDDLKLF